jgi:O-acetyl-ADP-ribose deacetylase (regulator of RNase III)
MTFLANDFLACSATLTTIGFPAISARGFRGKRVESSRAGMSTMNSFNGAVELILFGAEE